MADPPKKAGELRTYYRKTPSISDRSFPKCPVCKADVTQPDHPYPDEEHAHEPQRPEARDSADERTPLLPQHHHSGSPEVIAVTHNVHGSTTDEVQVER